MLIVCPSCASEYVIDRARIGAAGRDVRCAACKEAWFVRPSSEPSAGLPSALPERRHVIDRVATVQSSRRRPAIAPKRPPGRAAERVAIAMLGLVCLVVPAALALRMPIVAALPGSAALFAALGLPVNLIGLRLEDVTSGTQVENGARVLTVEGAILPEGERSVDIPRLGYVIEGQDGTVLYSWTTKPPVERVAPGETVRFTARLASPPPDGRRLLVTFAGSRTSTTVAAR